MTLSSFRIFNLGILVCLLLNSRHGCGFTGKDYTAHQLASFASANHTPFEILTTSSGAPVPLIDTQTIYNGNLLLNDFFVESISHLTSERIPERVVHAKGSGAFGYFKVTDDLSDICRAKLFSKVGKTTPVAVRFSSVVQRSGAPDTPREPRGFAVKFYTEEGNYDFVGIDFNCFLLKDPLLFDSFVHSFHKNPATMVEDHTARWDYLSQHDESLNMFMQVFGDRGIPNGYRYMPGFTIHTFELLNGKGEMTYARFHLLPDLGIRNLTTAEADRITDPDFATKDLYNAIAGGNFPTWTLSVQTIPRNEVHEADIFDVTKYWSEKLYPLRPIGTLVLNTNPRNYFADIEQLAFSPGNLVPGIRGVDSAFEARVLAYRLAHVHRLGINFNKIQVNCPFKTVARTYNRDGYPPVKDNEGNTPNYYPNSFFELNPDVSVFDPVRTTPNRALYTPNFDQANEVYTDMSAGEKCRLVANIVASLCKAERFLHARAVSKFKYINKDLANRIEHGLKKSCGM